MRAARARLLHFLGFIVTNQRVKITDGVGWLMEEYELGGAQARNMARDLVLMKWVEDIAGRLVPTDKGRAEWERFYTSISTSTSPGSEKPADLVTS